MANSLATLGLADVVAQCRRERSIYRREQTSVSSACIELFRRAFAGDQDAWAAVQVTFERQMRAWIGTQSVIEPDEVLQESLLSFYRSAPQLPNLLATDELGRILHYLRKCTKTALLMLLRKQQLRFVPLESLDGFQVWDDFSHGSELRMVLLDRIRSLIETPEEQLIFRLYFLCDMKPQDILERCHDRFADITAVNTIVQRLTRRMRKDLTLQQLQDDLIAPRRKTDSSASLEIRVLQDEGDRSAMDLPCDLDEGVLLDYITGRASDEARAAIERSAACARAARELAGEMLPLLRILYRADCPEPETLIAYQERQLAGTEQLVISRHVTACPLCWAECVLLDAVDAVPMEPASGPMRHLIEAVLAPAQQFALRGEIHHYQTPEISISVSARQAAGQPRTWTLHGEARTLQGLRVIGVVNAVMLRSLDQPDQPELEEEIEPDGIFIFRELPAGAYRLSLLTADAEIVIPQISVGDEP